MRRLLLLAVLSLVAASGEAAELSMVVRSGDNRILPCRIYLRDRAGKAHRPADLPFWRGGFVCEGKVSLHLPAGHYRYEIERGPEWSAARGGIEVVGESVEVNVSLRRLADLKQEGWFGGDLHVHRSPSELDLHLRAEDLSIASVQTWWNKRNPWTRGGPPEPLREVEGRFYHVLSGEDERGGGALLYHRVEEVIDITRAEREWPSSQVFLEEATEGGAWAEIEKPFWWDTPLWISTGRISSVGIAQNHMQRGGVLEGEAWGRPRDRARYPGVHGNGLYTQDLYYRILNCGLRLPPSAGSASGVLANPVGYNRVYVHTGAAFSWDTWWEGLRGGRCFVTNGPLLRLTANGHHPGETVVGNGPLRIVIDGRIDSRDAIRKIELVRNGKSNEIKLPATFNLEKSGWFLVRAIADVDETFRFASTGPWYAEIGGKKMNPDHDSAEFFLQWTRNRKVMVERALENEKQRKAVSAIHQEAVRYWEMMVAEEQDGEPGRR